MKQVFLTAVLLCSTAAHAADGLPVPASGETESLLGRSVADVIEDLRSAGYEIVYSTRLVPASLRVMEEPTSSMPLSQLNEILEQHDLSLEPDGSQFLVVPKRATEAVPVPTSEASKAETPEIETITVSASRYEISRDVATSRVLFDQRTIENMPDVGEDPIRMTQRLPGTAASGASARAHFRGGEQSEVGIVLNGQRLIDPFHIRDYQNVFSAIDSRAIDGVEVYTGGFPVRFGDRMSGLVVMESLDAEKPRYTEVGLSVFNTSFLLTGSRNDTQWLFSGRRGNLDLVIDDELGKPSYYDVFSRLSFDVGSRNTLSGNLLFADDVVTVVLESEPSELEEARSTTRNAQVWVQLDTEWSDKLSSRTGLSYTDYSNRRQALSNDRDKVVADVQDDRDVRQFGFRQDWRYRAGDEHLMQWGFAINSSRADYAYDATAEYFGLAALYRDQPPVLTRTATASPDGASYALYLADRWKLSPKSIIEWGLRWDDQTYTGQSSDSQLSPRVSWLFQWRPDTDFRLSWGRYHQSQGIQELQIEDGITSFWPAQRADHLIAGLQHRFNDRLTLRIEAFHKEMQDVRPRFENLFDPLALIPELSPDRIRLDPDGAKSSGLEISLDGDHGDWTWWSSYTLSKTTDAINGRDELRSWDQRHAVQAGINWSNDVWNVALAASAHTGWPTTELGLAQVGVQPTGEPILEAVPGPRNATRYATFSSIDFRVSRKFNVRRGSLTAFIEVTNVMDRDNVCCSDWDIDVDDAGSARLERSPDFWLPLLPAIGILWEF